MESGVRSALAEAWRALEGAEWERARTAFTGVLELEECGEALDGGGLAAWFLDDIEEGLALRERAVALYAREGDCGRAARVALWISHQYLIAGRASAANGWLARAERSLAQAPLCAGHGWLAVERARRAASVGGRSDKHDAPYSRRRSSQPSPLQLGHEYWRPSRQRGSGEPRPSGGRW